MPSDYLIFVLLALTITAMPGPAVILTIQNSVKYGYKKAILNILGNVAAMISLASLSALS